MSTPEQLSHSLISVGYKSGPADNDHLREILSAGLVSADFRQIVLWLTDELCVLGSLEERVSAPATPGDNSESVLSDFQLELSAFLKELQCPWSALVSGPVAERFRTSASCAQLIDYLIAELMAMKMTHVQMRKNGDGDEMVIEVSESPAASALKSILLDLNLGKPKEDVTAEQLFALINQRVAETIPKSDPSRLGPALFSPQQPLTAAQWLTLEQFHRELDAEYNLRRDMLITRLDVTVQSFQWGDKYARSQRDAIADRYAQRRRQIQAQMLRGGTLNTGLPALLAARGDLAVVERTVSAATRTTAAVQKHLMGGVPDRGGRTLEMSAPPPEMPSWAKRSVDAGGRGGGGRGGGRGRGGGGGGGRGGGPLLQNAGYPADSSGYQQSVGYGGGRGGGGALNGGHQQGGGHRGGHRGGHSGGGGRVQGGWRPDCQAGAEAHDGGYQQQQGGYQQHKGVYQPQLGVYQQQQGGYQQQLGGYQQQQGGYQQQQGGYQQQQGGYQQQQGGYQQQQGGGGRGRGDGGGGYHGNRGGGRGGRGRNW